jgi:hypothetical protein
MGKIELDHTGSGGGITLSSDGTDLLLDGTAVGGGGGSALELYAENPSTPTAPVATNSLNGVAIGDGARAGHVSFTGRDNAFAIGFSTYASAAGSHAYGYDATAGGTYSFAGGGNSSASGSQSIGSGSTALGGSYATGTDSFAAAIANNTSSYGATGSNSVAIGQLAKATGTSSVQIGRMGDTAGDYSVGIGNGSRCSSNAILSVALAATYLNAPDSLGFGAESRVDSGHDRSIVLGRGAKSRTKGGVHFGGFNAINAGNNQAGIYILVSDTTDATAEALTTNNSTASTDNQVILPNNSAYAFHGTIVARQQASGGTASAAWKVEGLIRREGSAGTTVLVNSATTVLDNTPSWGMALSADTTNGGLAITVTGAASTNIRWVATIHTSEVTYA